MATNFPLEEFLRSDDAAGGASEATISHAEATLGVRFPPSYRSFLAHFGAAYCNGLELAGLFHHPDKSEWLSSMTSKSRPLTEAEWMYSASSGTTTPFSRGRPLLWRHVVTQNLRNRRFSRGHIEPRYVAISQDDRDSAYTFYLDTGAPEVESPVVVLGLGLDYAPLAADFNAFVVACFNGTLPWFVRDPVTPIDLKWGPPCPCLAPGVPAAIVTGDPTKEGLYVIRLKIPAGYKIPAHTHPQDEHLTVISGSLYFALRGKLDEAKAKAVKAYGNAQAAKRMPHFAFTTEETIIQVHGLGPQRITFVDAADHAGD